jgi:hypothetical protein
LEEILLPPQHQNSLGFSFGAFHHARKGGKKKEVGISSQKLYPLISTVTESFQATIFEVGL